MVKYWQFNFAQPKRMPYFVNGTKTNGVSDIKGQWSQTKIHILEHFPQKTFALFGFTCVM